MTHRSALPGDAASAQASRLRA